MLKVTKIFSAALDKFGRRVLTVLAGGKSDVRSAIQASGWGIDGNPPKDFIALYARSEADGREYVVGILNKSMLAAIGENRIFSTNADGTILKAYVWLKGDGSIEFNGSANHLTRYEDLATGFNQLKSDHNALVAKWNAFCNIYVPGSPSTTGLPASLATSTVSASSASISNAKINELKTT